MPRKAEIEAELAAARKRIAALEAELANRESDQEDDYVPDTLWAQLRSALDGYVGKDADHYDLVFEAADHLRDYFRLPEGHDQILDQVSAYTEGLDDAGDVVSQICEAFELREEWTAHELEGLETAMWRAGLLTNGRSMFEVLRDDVICAIR